MPYSRIMDKLVWVDAYGGKLFQARGPEGSWSISCRPEGETARISFRPAYPKDEDYLSVRQKIKLLESNGLGHESWENQRLASYSMGGTDDSLYAHSLLEAKKLVEMIRTGDEGLPDAETIISSAGFKRASYSVGDDDKTSVWHYKLKNGSVTVLLDANQIRVTYDGRNANRWHNLLGVFNDVPNYNNTFIVYNFWPDVVTDIIRIGAAFLVWTLQQRLARGGRFQRPLVESDLQTGQAQEAAIAAT